MRRMCDVIEDWRGAGSTPALDDGTCEEDEQSQDGDGAAQDQQAIGRAPTDALGAGLKGAEGY